jgi:hypothetical protein
MLAIGYHRITMPVEELHIYCDEAGNSGANLLDLGQPTYVIAGWAVPPDNRAAVRVAIQHFRSILNVQANELKGSRILGRTRAQSMYGEFLRSMGPAGAFPVFAICHKRYWIAGKVVEKLLDPAWNRRGSWAFFADFEAKKALANSISEWPDAYLASFAAVLREPNMKELLEVIRSFQRLSRLGALDALDSMLLGAVENIDQIFEIEFDLSDQARRDLEPVNVSSLSAFLQIVESFGRNVPGSRISIKHDTATEFTRGFQYVVDHQINLPEWELFYDEPVVKKLQSVTSFEMVDSSQEELIQAADLLAHGLFQVSKAAAEGKSFAPWLLESLAQILFSAGFGSTPPGFVMGSDRFLSALYEPVGEYLPTQLVPVRQ